MIVVKKSPNNCASSVVAVGQELSTEQLHDMKQLADLGARRRARHHERVGEMGGLILEATRIHFPHLVRTDLNLGDCPFYTAEKDWL
jgi:hypothetical protein